LRDRIENNTRSRPSLKDTHEKLDHDSKPIPNQKSSSLPPKTIGKATLNKNTMESKEPINIKKDNMTEKFQETSYYSTSAFKNTHSNNYDNNKYILDNDVSQGDGNNEIETKQLFTKSNSENENTKTVPDQSTNDANSVRSKKVNARELTDEVLKKESFSSKMKSISAIKQPKQPFTSKDMSEINSMQSTVPDSLVTTQKTTHACSGAYANCNVDNATKVNRINTHSKAFYTDKHLKIHHRTTTRLIYLNIGMERACMISQRIQS
jgi:hypothetical protein